MRAVRVAVGCAALAAAAAEVRRPVPEFEVDLDAAPETRYTEVIKHFNSSIWSFYDKLDHAVIKFFLKELVGKRGNEVDELHREIEGIAKLAAIPDYAIHAAQMLYELNTLMVPIWNITIPGVTLPRITGPGCTGIIAMNKADGTVYHARNLDFSPASVLQNLAYTAIFKKGGKELYRAQTIAGYTQPLTAMKKGPDGFTYEVNTRFLDHHGGNGQLMKNLFTEKRPLNGWTVRKALETSETYEDFVKALSTAPYVSTMYNVIAGVKKGTILARDPDSVAYKLTLGEHNYENRDDYIIVTNFDYWYHDIREWFDPTGGKGIGHPRRPAAQKILNATDTLTPEVLFSVLDTFEVKAVDTIFQGIMNVETGLWNVSLPPCKDCPKAGGVETPILV